MPVRTKASVMAIANKALDNSDIALKMATTVSEYMGTISRSIEAMRAENSMQHSDGRKLISDGLDKVHQRISTVKEAQTENAELNSINFKKIDDRFIIVERKIDESRNEAKEGDYQVESKSQRNWDRVKNGVLLLFGGLIIAYISKLTGLSVQVLP